MIRVRLLCVLLLVAAAVSVARADNLPVTLSVSFVPPDPIVPSTLSGVVQFYLTLDGPNLDRTITNPFGDPIAINAIVSGESFSATFAPTNPCFGSSLTCTLGIAFLNGATLVPPDPVTPPDPITPPNPILPTFFFAENSNLPRVGPQTPPILQLGALANGLKPDPPLISQGGSMVAYDAPITVGTWSVTTTSVPEPSSLSLLAASLVMLVRLLRQGKKFEKRTRCDCSTMSP